MVHYPIHCQHGVKNSSNITFNELRKSFEDKSSINIVQQQHKPIYTNQFVVEAHGGEDFVKELAKKHGFVYLSHVSFFDKTVIVSK